MVGLWLPSAAHHVFASFHDASMFCARVVSLTAALECVLRASQASQVACTTGYAAAAARSLSRELHGRLVPVAELAAQVSAAVFGACAPT